MLGASYGGFASLGVMTTEPALFSCGIIMAGFGDLEKLLEDDKDKNFYDFEVMMMGDPQTEQAMIKKNSPIYQLNSLSAPLLIMHGKLDSRVKFHHAIQIENELTRLNKKFETFYLRDEGHTFIKNRNRVKTLDKIYSFLKSNN
jgi:dipeptidyl aminopeptidase/acylaminoacyl peptidase